MSNLKILYDQVQQEKKNPSEVYVQLDGFEKEAKELKEKLKTDVIDELDHEHVEEQEVYGKVVTKANVGATYDYNQDPEYDRLDKALKARKKKLRDQGGMVDPETGEQIPKIPVKNPSKLTVKVVNKK